MAPPAAQGAAPTRQSAVGVVSNTSCC